MVSVCMATYNGEKYLSEQLESILRQLGQDGEVIVSDDGSTDDTLSILERYRNADPRVKIYNNAGRHGVNANFENALLQSSGDFIFLSDQDDVWAEGKIERCLEALKNSDLVLHDGIITDKDLVSQNKTMFSELNVKGGFWRNFIRNRFTGCCMAFRREILDYILPIRKDVRYYHDSWIGLLVTIKGSVDYLNDRLIFFRRHESNNSTAGKGSQMGILSQLRYRMALGRDIIKRIVR